MPRLHYKRSGGGSTRDGAQVDFTECLPIALLNPFEIAKWGDDHSHEIWERLAAQECAELAGKRHGAPPDAGEGRNAITVLYYDDASIARLGKTLPLSAFDLADPRIGSRNADDPLALAVPSPSLDALGTIAAALPEDIAPHEYPLVSLQGAEARKQHRYRLYPAAALYAVWCGLPTAAARAKDHRPLSARPVVHDDDAGLNWSERFDAPLDIDWAAGPKLSGSLPWRSTI